MFKQKENSLRVLLVTYHPLKAINGGTKMYETILSELSDFQLFWFATGTTNRDIPERITNKFEKVSFITSFIFHKVWLQVFTKFPFYILHIFILYFIYTPIAVFRLLKLIKMDKVDVVWFEIFKQTYVIAYLLQKLSKVNVHLSFNDHYSAHSNFVERTFLRWFCKRLSTSDASFDFISECMLEYFRENYNFNSTKYVILWVGGINYSLFNRNNMRSSGVRSIVFYGSIHGLDTFYSFCTAIEQINFSRRDKINLDIYSEFNYKFIADKYSCVKYCGLVDDNVLSEIVQNYDLVYVPMYFDKKNKIVASTSISSKIVLAINLNVPIFCHAPRYAANAIFVKTHGIGMVSDSLNHKLIVDDLNRFNCALLSDYSENEARLALDLSDYSSAIENLKNLWINS